MNKRYYIYQDTRFFHELVGNRKMIKEYDPTTARYDEPLYILSQFVLTHGRFPKAGEDGWINHDLYQNNVLKPGDEIPPFTVSFFKIVNAINPD